MFVLPNERGLAEQCAEVAHGHGHKHVAVILAVNDCRVLVLAFAKILVGIAAGLADCGVEIKAGAAVAFSLKMPVRNGRNDHVRGGQSPLSLRNLRAAFGRKSFSREGLGNFALKRGAFLS